MQSGGLIHYPNQPTLSNRPQAPHSRGLKNGGLHKFLTVLFAVGLGLAACSREPEKTQPPALASVPQAPISSSASVPAAPDISEQEIKALIEAWMKSQNTGDFLAYQSLYAQRFTGIRRSGPRTVQLDRAGWMKDRKRMFQKAIEVEASDMNLQASPSTAVARFEQTWSSATYKDTGPKQLVLVKEDGALRISREEMLASKQIRGQASENGSFFHVIPQGVVVGSNPTPGLKTGPLQLLSRKGIVIVQGAVDPSTLPVDVRQLIGKKFKLMNETQELCEATLQDFYLVKRIEPHFGSLQQWNGEEGAGPRLSDAQVAEEVWSHFESITDLLLVGQVKGCKGATWARLAELPAPTFSRDERPSQAWVQAALKQFKLLPAYQATQKSYESEVDPKENHPQYWENYDGAKPTVRIFRFPGENSIWVSLNVSSGRGCGDFSGALWALWEVSGTDDPKKAKFKLLNNPDFGSYLEPSAAIDIDGDKRPEILFRQETGTETGIVRWKEGLLQDIEVFGVPSLNCPC